MVYAMLAPASIDVHSATLLDCALLVYYEREGDVERSFQLLPLHLVPGYSHEQSGPILTHKFCVSPHSTMDILKRCKTNPTILRCDENMVLVAIGNVDIVKTGSE
jgi:hypothetical protein